MSYSKPVPGVAGLLDGEGSVQADKPLLSQRLPNPLSLNTEIKYALPRDCYVRLEVFNIFGQRVAILVEGYEEAGYKQVKQDLLL